MLEILQFIFSSFWIWLGFTIDLAVIFKFGLLNIMRNREKDENNNKN